MILKKIKNKIMLKTGIVLMNCFIISSCINPIIIKAEDRKVKNVIYLIADGMNDGVLTAARYYKDIQDGKLGNDTLAMDNIRCGFVKTAWANGPITDSAPAATSLSSGYKTNPGVIGLNENNKPQATILEAAEIKGLSTGIISTSEIMHATPAAFSSHVKSRSDYNSIMKQQIYQNMEVILGGGSLFLEATGGGKRNDGDDLTASIKELGYDFVTSKSQMNQSKSDKIWGAFAEKDMLYDFDRKIDNNEDEPSLKEMTSKAVEVLEKNDNGFFLMVEGSKIDWAAHSNDPSGTIGDILSFDEAVKFAVDYAKKNQDTIVVVTTDHGNSGFSIGNESTTGKYDDLTFEESIMQMKDYKISANKFNSLIESKSDEEIRKMIFDYFGYKDITQDEMEFAKNGKINEVMKSRAKIGYTTGGHTGGDVYLGVYVPAGISKLRGTIDNTEIPKYLCDNLGIDLDNINDHMYRDLKSDIEKDGATIVINNDDPENPYLLISKEEKSLKVFVNSNKVEEFNNDQKISEDKLSTITLLIDDTSYGDSDNILKLLNKNNDKDDNDEDDKGDNIGDNKEDLDDGEDDKNINGNIGNDELEDNKNEEVLGSKLPNTGSEFGAGLMVLVAVILISAGFVGFASYKKI